MIDQRSNSPANIRLAIDTGALHGPRTGIGVAVDGLVGTLTDRPEVSLHPYVVSYRAALASGTQRLPLPATLAHRAWARAPFPRTDRWLGDVDLVHGTNYVVPPSKHRTVVTVYDCWFLRHEHEAMPAVRRAGAVLRAAVRRGAMVHTSSLATEHAVRELLHTDRVRTVHLGAAPLPQTSAPTPDVATTLAGRPFIVAIGTIERRKNLPQLIGAFATAATDAALADLLLVIAGGDGDDRDAVDQTLDSLPTSIRQRVVLLGRVTESDRGWLLRHARALAYPSLDEGFGFPLLDAMQAGIPIVATQVGSIPEVAGKAALLVPLHDLDALAAALATVVTDDQVRGALLAAGGQQWRQFTWQRCADGLIDLYRHTLTN
jgi:glycosyltransferase involved in cell wall biosynthesis